MAKIGFFNLEPWEIKYIKPKLKKHKLVFIDKNLTEANATKYKDLDIAAVFVYSQINEKVLSKMPKLKLVTTMSTGYDHLDIECIKKKKVTACSVPAYGDNTVAEHAFGLLLTISKNLAKAIQRTRKKDFSIETLMGFDLKGKTLGIIGTGRIGAYAAKIGAKGFGMNVIAFDKYPNRKLAKEIGFKYVAFNELLKKSDIISIHVPLLPSTKHLISCKNISKIKKGCVLINTARGGVVETHAIVQGLKKGIFKAVGLDVLEEEHAIKDERQMLQKEFKKKYKNIIKTIEDIEILLKQPNVYITPHNAFYTKEALQRIIDTTVENINGFLKGKPVNICK